MRRPESVADYDTPFTSSIVRYPQRGPDGDNRYRGNTSGYIIRQFLATYHGDRRYLTFDPMEGSGTCGDAARSLGIPYRGFDLKDGFDAQRHDIRTRLGGEAAGSAFVHPPYAGMIRYSSTMWGASPSAADLSEVATDIPLFEEMLQAVLMNVHSALRPGAAYGVLLGLWRNGGKYHDLPSRLVGYAPGGHIDTIIKEQTNVTSAAREYSGNVVRISHEVLHVFRRAEDASIFAVAIDGLDRLQRLHTATWRNLVVAYARERGEFTLAEIYADFEQHPRSKVNANYRAKLRQVLQRENDVAKIARGRYAIAR